MLFKQLLFAASAAAILVVPDTTSDSEDGIFRTLPVDLNAYDIPAAALSQSLEVPCPSCRGRDTHLKLDFTVEGSTHLLLNGFELYPNADPWQGDLTATAIKGNGKTIDRKLGYGLAVRPEGMDESQKLEVVSLELLIIEVGDRFVSDVPRVSVKLIKALTGDILIGSVNVEAVGSSHADQCTTIWCRVQGLFNHVWQGAKSKAKGCKGMHGHGHGHKSPHHGQHSSDNEAGFPQDGHRGHGHHGKFGHQHHHHHHSWSVLKHIASFILLPVILGITAGVGVAVLAMFFGTLVMRLIRIVKGGPPEDEAPMYVDHKISIVEFLATDEEKAGLMEYHDAPPEYEDEPSRN